MKRNDGLMLLFIGLKLSGHINWSWGFVLIPFYLEILYLTIKAFQDEIKKYRRMK